MAKPKYVKFLQIGLTANQVKAIKSSFVDRITDCVAEDIDPDGQIDNDILNKSLVPLVRDFVEEQQDRIMQCVTQMVVDNEDWRSCGWDVDVDSVLDRKSSKRLTETVKADIKPQIDRHEARKRSEEIEQLEQRAYELGYKLVATK